MHTIPNSNSILLVLLCIDWLRNNHVLCMVIRVFSKRSNNHPDHYTLYPLTCWVGDECSCVLFLYRWRALINNPRSGVRGRYNAKWNYHCLKINAIVVRRDHIKASCIDRELQLLHYHYANQLKLRRGKCSYYLNALLSKPKMQKYGWYLLKPISTYQYSKREIVKLVIKKV